MAFCTGFSSKLRKVMHDITPVIEEYANYALTLTGILKSYAGGDLASLVAAATGTWGTDIQGKVLDALNKAETDVGLVESEAGKDLETQLNDLAKITFPTEYAKNSMLIKLAARIVAHLDGNGKQEHFYDTVVQGAALK